MRRSVSAGSLLTLVFSFLANVAGAQSIQLSVDLSDASRNIYHSQLTIPVKPGPLTLVYPEWIPGNHRPAGPIANVTGIKMEANKQTLAWQRDPIDMYAFHVDVPCGRERVEGFVRYHHQRRQCWCERTGGDHECPRLELEPSCALSAGSEFGCGASGSGGHAATRMEIRHSFAGFRCYKKWRQ